MKKIKPTFKENVSETLLIPLYMRAKEAEEKNPIIVDEVSQKILAKIDYNFNKFSADKRCQFCISVRTKYFDEILRNFVAKYDDAVVVLLACGLDPRIERTNVGKPFSSYLLDFADVIDFRRNILPESVSNQYIIGDITNREWIDTVKAQHPNGHFLFIMEGVAMYLTENQIKRIFKNIDNNFPNAEIHIERISKNFSQRTETQQSVSATNATFVWGCDNPLEIEDWGLKLKFQSEFYYFSQHFSQMYKRLGIKAFILKYLSKYRRSIGIWSYRKAG